MTEALDNLIALIEAASRPNLPWGRILAVPVVLVACFVVGWALERRGAAPGTVARNHEG